MAAPLVWSRGLLVWSAVTAVAVGGARVLLPGTDDLTAATSFDRLLVGVATLALLGCLVWGWLVTTVVVGEALLATRGSANRRGHDGVPGVPVWARRLVLAACGTALAVGATPAHAAPGSLPPAVTAASTGSLAADVDIDGLPFPDRPSGPDQPAAPRPPVGGAAAPRSAAPYVVRAGDSLWAITEQALADGRGRPSAAEVADAVARTYAANHRIVGEDPDLILPGQQLRLPPRT